MLSSPTMAKNPEHRDLFPGALEVMILQSLRLRPMHGYALVKHIKQVSDNLLQVEEGSLYPALQRMLRRAGWNRRPEPPRKGRPTRIYRLTDAGVRHLEEKSSASKRCSPALRACWPSSGLRRDHDADSAQVFCRRRRYDDLSVSIQEHIEERIEELMEDGRPRKQAEQRARREFGNVALIQQRSREVWQWRACRIHSCRPEAHIPPPEKVSGICRDCSPDNGIGIGANTAVFSVVNGCAPEAAALSPFRTARRALTLNAPGAEGMADFTNGLQLSPSMYLTFSERNRTFQSLGVWTPWHRKRHRGRPTGGSSHSADQRRRAGDARRAPGGPVVL